jgi:hypothetical protein
VIVDVSPALVPTTGGIVTITGENLGSNNYSSAITQVYYGGEEVQICTSTTNPLCTTNGPTQLEVIVKPGSGTLKRLEIVVDGQRVGLAPGATDPTTPWAFEPPLITAVQPLQIPTTGHPSVNVTVSNLGIPGTTNRFWLAEVGDDTLRPLDQTNAFGYGVTIVEQDSDRHAWARLDIEEGEGNRLLVVNVSGNINAFELNYSAPVILSSDPSPLVVPTAGGTNVTLFGENFGFGQDYKLTVKGAAGYDEFVPFVYPTEYSVRAITQNMIVFVSPEGQSDVPLQVALNVPGQRSNPVLLNFSEPTVQYLAHYSSFEYDSNGKVAYARLLGSNCERASADGCDLPTSGGYDIAIVGTNFGVANREVVFNGETFTEYDTAGDDDGDDNLKISIRMTVISHELIRFRVPPGVGANLSVAVKVGTRRSNSALFSYDPPWIQRVSDDQFHAIGDTITIMGSNFAFADWTGKRTARAFVGGIECAGISAGASSLPVWLPSGADGEPYVLCETANMPVGPKNVSVYIGGQWGHRLIEDAIVSPQCPQNYYGHAAWTAYTLEDRVSCFEECSEESMYCMSLWDGKDYGQPDDDDRGLDCWEVTPCKKWQSTWDDTVRANCTVITRTDEYCVACPAGSFCDAYSPYYSVEPVALAGYWRSDEDGLASGNCESKRSHRTTCYAFVPCDPAEACLGENGCTGGYTGQKCSLCCDYSQQTLDSGEDNPDCMDLGSLYYRRNGGCEPCPGDKTLTFALMGTAALVAGAFAYELKRKRISIAIIAIGVDYLQVLSIFADTNADWPNSIQQVYNILSIFSFNLNVATPECSFPVTYEQKWFFVETMPVVIVFCIGVVSVAMAGYKKYVKNRKGKRVWEHAPTMFGTALLAFYYIYLYVSSMSLDVFNCGEVLSEDGVSDGKRYLSSEPSLQCSDFGYEPLQGWACVTTLFYSIGFPVLLCWLFFKQENRNKILVDQLLRAQNTGHTRDLNPKAYEFRLAYGPLYYRFRPEKWYWMVIIVARKFAIVMAALLFRRNTTIQMCMILLVMFLAYASQVRNSPYMSEAERGEVLDHFENEVKAINEYIRKMNKGRHAQLATKNRRKRVSIFKRASNYEAGTTTTVRARLTAKATASYFFNYNTVESVLLASAVLVCNFGIIFESNYVKNSNITQQALANATLSVVFMSLGYFAIVAWSEIIGGLFPSLACSWLSGQRQPGDDDDEEEVKFNEDDFDMEVNKIFDDNQMRESQAEQTLLTIEQQDELQLTLKKLEIENGEIVRKIDVLEAEIAGEKKAAARGRLKGAGRAALLIGKQTAMMNAGGLVPAASPMHHDNPVTDQHNAL